MNNLEIENGVLYNCKNSAREKEITVPEGVTRIASRAFAQTTFERIVLPDGLKSIEYQAFSECEMLRSIQIPESVKEIEDRAFELCDGLADENGYIVVNGILFGFSEEKRYAMRCDGEDLVLPEGVSIIGGSAFKQLGRGCKTIQLPSSLREIRSCAFWNSADLQRIDIPYGVVSIGEKSFQSCYSLRLVSVPGSVKYIGENAFDECPLDELFVPGAFFQDITGTKMKALAFKAFMRDPQRYKNEEVAAGYRKYLISQRKKWLPEILKEDRVDLLQIIADAKKITAEIVDEEYLDQATAAKAVNCTAFLLDLKNRLPGKAKQKQNPLEEDPYKPTNIKKEWNFEKRDDGTIELTDYKGTATEVIIPDRVGNAPVTRLGSYLFSPEKPRRKKTLCAIINAINKVIIPDSVTEIGDYAFASNNGITAVVFSSALKEKEDEAFSFCINLSSDTVAEKDFGEVRFGKGVFLDCWKLTDPEGFIIIQDTLHACNTACSAVQVPDGVVKIAAGAFSRALFVDDITMPDSVEYIDEEAFRQFFSVTIHAHTGSYAEQYAKKHNIPFVEVE